MKAILSGGLLLALCQQPRYVKLNEESGAYVEATEEDAIGLSVGGTLYNLPGSTTIPDAPEAIATDGDMEEFIFQNRARIIETEASTGAAIIGVEDALCEQDAANDERMSAIEDAICELDSAVNGGGEKK